MFQVTPLSQTDPRWNHKRLGNDTITIGKYGCLLTALTMVANGFGFEETPDSLNQKMRDAGGFVGANIIPALMPTALPGMRFKKTIMCRERPAPLSEIDSALAAGLPVIVELDYSPKAGLQNHWVVLLEKQGDDYRIQDPYPFPAETKQVRLLQRFGFGKSPVNVITAAVWLEGPSGPVPKPKPKRYPKAIPLSGFEVFVAADGLALRDDPFEGPDNLIKRLPLGAKLYAEEPEAEIRRKVGTLNEWLKVQETHEGFDGYSAAWYLSLTPEVVPEPVEPEPEPERPQPERPQPERPQPSPSQPLILFAMVDQLALRRAPNIDPATLIKRLPQNSQLLVLEPAETARAKVGAANQWLQVRDIECDEGYIAAWLVSVFRQEVALGVYDKKGRQPHPGASNNLVLSTAVDQLALRRLPLVAEDTLIKRLPLQSDLLVLEPVAEAASKIGQANQWIQVRDIEGQEGYVAAWYVMERQMSLFG